MPALNMITRIFKKEGADCIQVRKLSSDFLEGALPPSRLQRIQAHLSNCGPCRSFVDGLASMMGMLRRLPKAESPSTLKGAIMQRIAEEGKGNFGKG